MSQLIGVPREVAAGEKRVATVPEVVEKLIKLGFRVAVEAGAGGAAPFFDHTHRAPAAPLARRSLRRSGRAPISFSRCARPALPRSRACARARLSSVSSGPRRT